MLRHLAIFSATWLPVEGGAERQLRQVADALTRQGWVVTVIAGGPADAPELEHSVSGVRIHRVLGRRGRELPTGVELAVGCVRAALAVEPTVVVGSLVSGASLAAMAYGRATGVPRLLRIGGDDFRRLTSSVLGRSQGRFMVRSSNTIVVNAPHLYGQLDPFMTAHHPPVTLIRNGVEAPRPTIPSPRRAGPLRVIYYTNAGRAKNDGDFLRIVAMMPHAEFRAIGRTTHLDPLPNLDRRGWSTSPETELEWADVVLNTSSTEGSPNFCLQGIALGRRVVGFSNDGVTDIAKQYPRHVAVVAFGDITAAVEALSATRLYAEVDSLPSVRTIGDAALEWDMLLSRLLRHVNSSPKLRRI